MARTKRFGQILFVTSGISVIFISELQKKRVWLKRIIRKNSDRRKVSVSNSFRSFFTDKSVNVRGMSSSDDDVMEDGRFQLFLDDDDEDDSGSEDEDDVNDVDDDDEDDDTSTDTEDPRFKSSLLRNVDFNEDDIIEEDDDDFVGLLHLKVPIECSRL